MDVDYQLGTIELFLHIYRASVTNRNEKKKKKFEFEKNFTKDLSFFDFEINEYFVHLFKYHLFYY